LIEFFLECLLIYLKSKLTWQFYWIYWSLRMIC